MLEMLKKPEQETIQKKSVPNQTGIPDQMKSRFEAGSGLSLDDVRIHYQSGLPAEIGALAYTQGTQVFVGPGQERHLPHELGHVVQQKQGLVRPTCTIGGLPVNDDAALERQADESRFSARPIQLQAAKSVVSTIQCCDSDSDDNSDSDDDYVPRWELKPSSARLKFVGTTPLKTSKTGKRVMKRMLDDESSDDDTMLVEDPSAPNSILLLTAHTQEIYALDDPQDATHIDMGHLYAAVFFWNQIGRYTGARSACVQAFMHDPNNYRFQYGARNCQMAPHDTYLPVASKIDRNFEYIPCRSVGDSSNFEEMMQRLDDMGLRTNIDSQLTRLDAILPQLVAEQSPPNWIAIAQKAFGFTAKQCRDRWVNHLNDAIKTTPFEKWEDDLILKQQSQLGNHWATISKFLPGRSAAAIKNRWNSHLKYITSDAAHVLPAPPLPPPL